MRSAFARLSSYSAAGSDIAVIPACMEDGLAVADRYGANGNIYIHMSIESYVAYGPAIHLSRHTLDIQDNFHRAYLGSSGN
ncbi:hypothetical protein ACVWZ6_003013 [Bradyrhizobium sp. GM6.1]